MKKTEREGVRQEEEREESSFRRGRDETEREN